MTVSFTDILVLLALAGLAYLIVHYLPQIKAFIGTVGNDGKAAEARIVAAVNHLEDLLHIHHASVVDKIAAIVPQPTVRPLVDLSSSQTLPIDPVAAVTRYIAGGLTTAVGMPTPYELRWLYAQPKAAQVAWGTAVAKAFDSQLAPVAPPADLPPNATFTANTETVGEIPVKMRTEAASYLFAVGGGFPNIGVCNWTLT